jgi:hypothetical protein
MIGKKTISLFLLLVFLVPVLPVVQVGALISQEQMNEELPHHGTDAIHQPETIASIEFPPVSAILSAALNKRAHDEHVCSRQADDIQTPPPNGKEG